MSHPTFTSQPQSVSALWPVLIFRPAEGRRLSWPGWLGETLRWFGRWKTVAHPSTGLLRWPGIELVTIESQVQYPNHWTTEPLDYAHHRAQNAQLFGSVSYTHLTLPTIYSV